MLYHYSTAVDALPIMRYLTNSKNIAVNSDSRNGGRVDVILNGEPLEEVDCFKYLGLQVAVNGGCEMDVVHSMNEGY